ncbi:MAG: prenyltransferase/squalene oxidase repeat-containing protein, partial [Promethearchaeota archaeon]
FSLIIPSLRAVTSRKDSLVSFIKKCETESGFANIPGASEATLEATFQALYILDGLNMLSDINTDSVIEFVNKCKNEDHGFGNSNISSSNIYTTYYALWIEALLDIQLDNDTDDWVANLYNETGGFKDKYNSTETLYATYFGLEALYINNTDLGNYNLSTWLIDRQNTNPSSEGYGGFATDGNSSNIWATWAAMGSISRLNISEGFLIEPLVLWINSSQNLNIYTDNYGAFSSSPAENDYSLLPTYAALYSIQKLGNNYLTQVNLDIALDWLIDLQNEDGGFRVNSIESDSSLSASYYAFRTLDCLGERNRLLADAPWKYKVELPLWLWILIGFAIVITAILIIRKYYIY